MKRFTLMFLPLLATATLLGCGPQTNSTPKDKTPVTVNNNVRVEPKTSAEANGAASVRQTSPKSISPKSQLPKLPPSIKGVYISRSVLINKNDEYFRGLQSQSINALVIDIKDDSGRVFTDSQTKARVQEMKNLGFYTVGRLVAFKDATACRKHPKWVLMRSRDWLNPANPQVQRYNQDIAARAATLGIDEVEWDYVRYPDSRISYSQSNRSKTIARFLADSRSQLHAKHVRVSADVFGLVTTAHDDMGIGQLWESLSASVDTISPMIYPSHYGSGHYQLKSPVHSPAGLIRGALKDAVKRNNALIKNGITPASIRPWLQDFDYKASYGPKEIRAQIDACHQLHIPSYLLWNPESLYSSTSFR